jgi:antitoxin PrlF
VTSTGTDKGQVNVPKAIRDRLGICAGTRIDFEIQSDDALKVRVLTRGANGLFALLARPGEAARSQDDIDAGIAAAVVDRERRKR